MDLTWVPWLLHAGLSPDHASGGLPAFDGEGALVRMVKPVT